MYKRQIDGTVTNSDLAAFLSTQAGSEIKDVNVTIDKDNISLTGQMNVGMVFKGAVKSVSYTHLDVYKRQSLCYYGS